MNNSVSILRFVFVGLAVIFLTFFIVSKVKSHKKDKEIPAAPKQEQVAEPYVALSSPPSFRMEDVIDTLYKGVKKRHLIGLCDSVWYGDPGVSYWKQAENSDSVLIGGGLPYARQSERANYVDLWANQKDTLIGVIRFKRKQ